MHRKRSMLNWAANTRQGNATMIAAGVVIGIAIFAFAWIAVRLA